MFKIITIFISTILMLLGLILIIIVLGLVGHFIFKFIFYAIEKIIKIFEKDSRTFWKYSSLERSKYDENYL